MRRTRMLVLLLTLIGAVAGLSPSRAASGSSQVNDDAEPYYNHIFPSLAAHPADPSRLLLVDVKRLTLGHTSSYRGECILYSSADAGATWGPGIVLPVRPNSTCRRVPPPKVTFASPGLAHVAYYSLAGDNTRGSILVSQVTFAGDGSLVLGNASEAPGSPLQQALHESRAGTEIPRAIALAAEGSNVYVGWNSTLLHWVSRSTNGGRSFSAPVVLTAPKVGYASDFWGGSYHLALAVVRSRLSVVMTFASCSYPELVGSRGCWHYGLAFSSSDDAGVTFSEPATLAWATIYDTGSSGADIRPAIAVDPTDPRNVYVVYQDSSEGTINYNIYLVRSRTAGATWDPPVLISGDEEAAFPQERPVVAVSDDGRVDIAWYDGRNDPRSPEPCEGFTLGQKPPCTAGRDIYYTYSTDGGNRFSADVRVTPQAPPDPRTGSTAAIEAATRVFSRARRSVDAALGAVDIASHSSGVVFVWEQSRIVPWGNGGSTTNWDLRSTRLPR